MRFYLTPWSGKRSSEVWCIAIFYFVLYVSDAASATITWRVLEESKPGTFVGSLRQYTASFVSYELSSSSKNFVYDKATGRVNTRKAIDRDVLSGLCSNGSQFETIQFTSTKNGDPDIHVKVLVDDINDNWPQFTSDIFTKVVSEETARGFKLRIPTALDRDCGYNGTLQYQILNATDSQYFSISTNQEFLDIVLEKKLDRETKEFQVLSIRACDNGVPSKCNSTIVNITVTDFNDNKPIFHNVQSEVRVKEQCDSYSGSKFILALNVTDRDNGKNGQFTLSVSKASDGNGLFVITSNKYLESTKCLTYDKTNPYINVVISAVDQGVPVQRNDVTIRIVVVDINDHYPALTVVFLFDIYENQPVPNVGILKAIDDDDGENANVNLTIINGNLKGQFYLRKLGHATGLFYLKLNGVLDREEFPIYNITIEGSDQGTPPQKNCINVIVPVLDQNDNHPNCSFPNETVFLSEASPVGSFVTVVQAIDKDEGKNGEIKYSLADNSNSTMFKIVEGSGLITTNGLLDYERQTLITLQVNVKDNGDPVLSSFCSLTIIITDINDNKPLFTNTTFHFIVREDAIVNSVVAKLSACDADAGKNARFTFSIIFPTPLLEETFSLNSTSGTIQVHSALDRETCDFYHFLVKVQDNSDPTLFSTATVEVTILDINDNQPVFYPRDYYVNIPINQSNGFIANVTAVDIDENDVIVYEIVHKDPQNDLFNVDKTTGTVTYTNISQLDAKGMYTVKLLAKDSEGHVSNISMLYVTVITPQDELPQFEMDLYSFSMRENAQHGTYIGQVRATGNDISYHVYSGDSDGIFSINDHGEIRTSGDLDHEKQSLIKLKILARTSGQSVLIGWTAVVIVVEDVNDNQPTFQPPEHLITVKSTAPVGSFVYKAMASDPDLGNGGIVRYEMLHDSDPGFSIHAKGDIFVASDLSKKSNYSPVIRILASDFGLPQLSSVLNLTINIAKENSHPPFIHKNFGVIPLPRNATINQPFFGVTASDLDGDNGEEIYFHLLGTDNATYFFGIFPEGKLYVKQPLSFTSQSDFTLQVVATNRGTPQLKSTTFIHISVLNNEHHQRLFQRDIFRFDVYENESPGAVVGKLDTVAKFGNLELDFIEQYAHFTFDQVTDEIKTKQVLDREQLELTTGTNHYVLFVKAFRKDSFGLRTADLATIVVEVKDRNDNAPVFSKLKYVVDMRENDKVGTVIFYLITSDKDEDKNAKVNFSIVTSSLLDAVGVDEEGRIVLDTSLENKHISYFNLSVQVTNIVPPYFNSTCFIEVMVHDVNNNKPQFGKSSIRKSISENFAVGQTVYRTNASDSDIGRNSLITYDIISGNQGSNFKIDPQSGEVILVKKLDFEEVQSYGLTISARDSGIRPLSTKQALILNITDVNDNSPHFINCSSELKVEENAQ